MREYAVVAGMGLLLSGCTSIGAAARIDPPKVATYGWARCVVGDDDKPDRTPKKKKERPINLDCFRFPEQSRASVAQSTETVVRTPPAKSGDALVERTVRTNTVRDAGVMTAYDAAVVDPAMRNRLAAVLLKQADDQCARNNGIVVRNEIAVNTILDLLTTGLTAAATIVTGAKADSILTGVGTFTSGARGQINADVYRGQITQAITTAIASEQKRLRGVIDTKRSGNVDTYNVDEMIRDVNEYYQTCSFYKGLELVLKSADDYTKLAEVQKRATDARDLQYLEARLATVRTLIAKLNAAASPDADRLKLATDEEAQLVEFVKQRRIALYGASQPATATTDDPPEPPAPPAGPDPVDGAGTDPNAPKPPPVDPVPPPSS